VYLHGVDAKPSECIYHGLTVKKNLGQPRTRRISMIPKVANLVDMGVHNSTIVNLERGVLERVFFVKEDGKFVRPPQPIPKAFSLRLSTFRSILLRCVPTTTPTSREKFPLYYRGRKRTIYEKAVASLARRDVDSTDAQIKCFVKAEKINFTAKKDPAPRIISPRDPRYNVAVGCYLKHIEHMLYGAIAKAFGETTVSKGLNVEDVASLLWKKWASMDDPVAIGLDASRFDQHVSRDALQWEHSIYNGIYHDPFLAKMLSWQLNNKCRGWTRDGFLKYTTDGTRMSGDMNTAMGNCLIMCGLLYSYSQERGARIKLVNNGDDCVVIVNRKDLPKFERGLVAWFREMGFTMKVDQHVDVFEKIQFCQMQPVHDGSKYVMVRNPVVSIAKDSISIKPLDSLSMFQKWIGAVGEGGVSLTGGIPILQSFYCCLERGSGGKRLRDDPTMETGWWYLSRGMSRKVTKISQRARFSFYLAFGIGPAYQIAIEEYYDSVIPPYSKPSFRPVSRPNKWVN
jgi:hypothetical protein